MPLDASLPPPRLPRNAGLDEIVRHFPAAFGVRVDLDDLPRGELLRLAGARLPEPPEARLLDRALQLVPPPLLRAVDRILMVDSGLTGTYGMYLNGLIGLHSPALRVHDADPRYGGRLSYFSTTVVHEVRHAVYARELTPAQRASIVELYLTRFVQSAFPDASEPSEAGAEHYFVDMFVAALLGQGGEFLRAGEARERLRVLGLALS